MSSRFRLALPQGCCPPFLLSSGAGISRLLEPLSCMLPSLIACLGFSLGNLTRSHGAKLQVCSMTFSHLQNWYPLEDSYTLPNLAAVTMYRLGHLDHSVSVLTLRKHFPEDSPHWCWFLLNHSWSFRPNWPRPQIIRLLTRHDWVRLPSSSLLSTFLSFKLQ